MATGVRHVVADGRVTRGIPHSYAVRTPRPMWMRVPGGITDRSVAGPRPIRVAHAKVVLGWAAAPHRRSADKPTARIRYRMSRSLRAHVEHAPPVPMAATDASIVVSVPPPPRISAHQYLESLEKKTLPPSKPRVPRQTAPLPPDAADFGSADPANPWLLSHPRWGLWLLGVLVVSGTAMVAVLRRAARTAGESALVAPAWMASLTPDGGGDTSRLADPQIVAYTQLTAAIARWNSGVFAAGEAMVFFTLLAVVLLWFIARRVRLTVPAAVGVALAFVVVSIGVHPRGVVNADTVALPWALLAVLLALSARRQILGFVLAGLALTIAMLTSVVFVAALPIVVALMVRSASVARRVWPLVTGGLMLAAGVVASVLPVVLSGDVPADTDAILPGLLTLTIPLAMIIAAGVVDMLVARIRRTAPARATAVAIVAVFFAGVLLLMPTWPLLVTEAVPRAPSAPMIAAQEWIVENVDPSQRMVVDDVMRADLVAAGWRDADVDGYPTASAELPIDWRDADVVVTRPRTDLVNDSVVVARFGEASDAVEIRQVRSEGLAARTSAAVAAAADRQRAGSELAQNQRLILADDARAALIEGRVDERIILILGALAADAEVAVDGFPVVDGEEGRTLRQVSLSRLQDEPLARDDRTSALATRLIDALRGDFAPDSVSAEDDALVLRYPIDTSPLVP